MKIVPTIFAKSKKEFNERFNKLSISNSVQIDFMDGRFVKIKGVGIKDIPNLKNKNILFEAHLMVYDPERFVHKLKKKGFRKVIFHWESLKDILKVKKLIDKIKDKQMEAWIAINPGTSVKKVSSILGQIDGLLFMGVVPGKEGQDFILNVYTKILITTITSI